MGCFAMGRYVMGLLVCASFATLTNSSDGIDSSLLKAHIFQLVVDPLVTIRHKCAG